MKKTSGKDGKSKAGSKKGGDKAAASNSGGDGDKKGKCIIL